MKAVLSIMALCQVCTLVCLFRILGQLTREETRLKKMIERLKQELAAPKS
jgi:hypothetical protein